MKKKIAIIQPFYIPWIGYFKIIKNVDEFVFLDDVQYSKRSFMNRNYINTYLGKYLLTIPVSTKGKFHQKIIETNTIDDSWKIKHLNIIKENYKSSNNFSIVYEKLLEAFNKSDSLNLNENIKNINSAIINFLDIDTKITYSSSLNIKSLKQNRIIEICKKINGDIYLSGPRGKNYLDEEIFKSNYIELQYVNYNQYTYPINVKHHKFIENLSIIDLMMNLGRKSIYYI